MKSYRKTLLGSLVAFFIGTSCCWLGSAAIFIGGATSIGVILTWVEGFQTQIISLGVLLAIISAITYKRSQNLKS